MSIERLAQVLKGVGFEIEPLDVAEVIWLARYLRAPEDDLNESLEEMPAKLPASGNNLNPKDKIVDKVASPSAAGKDNKKNRVDDNVESFSVVGEDHPQNEQRIHQTFEPESEEKGTRTEIKEVSAAAGLYLRSKSVEQAGGLAFRSAGTSALPGKLAYGRALRPLMRGFPSQSHFTLDEEATVHRIADTQVWLPVMRPEQTRWLELEIVIDEWPSIALWRDGIRELIIMLTNLGAFRSVQIWSLWTDSKSGNVELHHGWGANAKDVAPRPVRELNAEHGNRLVFVLSECISPSWYDGTVGNILDQWGHTEMVVLMQLLPDKFWRRTGLVNATSVLFRSSAPGKSNTQLNAIPTPDSHNTPPPKKVFPVPVLSFDPQLVSMWAQSITGKNNLWIPGVLLPLDKHEGSSRQQLIKKEQDQESASKTFAEDIEAKALNLVKRYRQNASADAWKLAGYLSATSPLNLRVIQLIQRVMLPEIKLEHIGEFYLSGLIKHQKRDAIVDDKTYFEFVPGVRSILQSSIKRSELVAVLQQTTQFINRETGSPIDLESSVISPSLASISDLDESPFAKVLPSVLRRLGGAYARLADSLEGKTTFEEKVVTERTDMERKDAEEAERLVTQKAEQERTAISKAETERKAKAEAERIAMQKLEEERIANLQAEGELEGKDEANRPVTQKAEIKYSELEDGIRLITLIGWLDNSIEKQFAQYCAADNISVLIDLSQAKFLSADTVRMLTASLRTVKKRGGWMAIFSPQPNITQVLNGVGVSQVIPIYEENLTTALKAVKQKFEEERIARLQTEAELKATAETERIAAQKAEQERITIAKAETERKSSPQGLIGSSSRSGGGTILLDGSIVHYESLGRGNPVIFLHGWIGSWRYWLNAMQVASSSFHAYALDLWGFGNTAHNVVNYSLELQSTLLDRFLNEMGIGKIAIIGHGLGALIGLKFAGKFPQSVDRIMAVSCPLHIDAVNSRLRTASPQELTDWLSSGTPEATVALSEANKADGQAITASLVGLQADNIYNNFRNLNIPCLLVYGDKDPAIFAPDDNFQLSTMTQPIYLDGSGHFPMIDDTIRFNRILMAFLRLDSGVSPAEIQLK